MKKYLKFMPFNSIELASRNKRELSTAKEYGYDTYVYCKQDHYTENENFKIIQALHPQANKKIFVVFRKLVTLRNNISHMRMLKKIKADVISCHNIKSFVYAYIAYLFTPSSKRPKFIYDSHEFELGRKKRNKISYEIVRILEKVAVKKCAFSIVVCEGIAEQIKRIHKVNANIVVVRSMQNTWDLNDKIIEEKHLEFCEKLKISSDSFIVMYHGAFVPRRGMEELISAMKLDEKIYSVFVGEYSNSSFRDKTEKQIDEYMVRDRIIKYPMQKHEELWKYVAAADCGIILMNAENVNYSFALPNKFFENIQCLTPIICTGAIELRRIINEYDIGIVSESGNVENLAKNIEKLRNDKVLYNKFKANLVKAKKDLCWEKEKVKFFQAFELYL